VEIESFGLVGIAASSRRALAPAITQSYVAFPIYVSSKPSGVMTPSPIRCDFAALLARFRRSQGCFGRYPVPLIPAVTFLWGPPITAGPETGRPIVVPLMVP
jgi:hypothetical protein